MIQSGRISKQSYFDFIFLGILLLCHVYFKFFSAEFQFYGDQVFSAFYAQQPLSNLLEVLNNEANPPLFFVILHFWIGLFGLKTMALKSLPIVFSLGTAVALFFLGKKISGSPSAILLSVLFLFSDLHFDFSHELRAFSLASLLSVISYLLFIHLLEKPESRKLLIAYTLVNLLLPYSHYNAVLVPLTQCISIFLFYPLQLRKYKLILLSYLASAILFIPQLFHFFGNIPGESFWLSTPTFEDLIFVATEVIGHEMYFLPIMAAVSLLFVIGISPLRKFVFKERFDVKIMLAFILWYLLPLIISFVVAQFTPSFRLRYFLFCSFGLYAALAYGIGMLKINRVILIIAAFTVSYPLYNNFHPADRNIEDWKGTADIVKTLKKEETGVYLCAGYMFMNLAYYLYPDDFPDYENLLKKMESRNIFPVNEAKHINDRIQPQLFKDALLILSHEMVVDPKETVPQYFVKHGFKLCETYGPKYSVKVLHFRKENEECISFEGDTTEKLMTECAIWDHSIGVSENSAQKIESYSLIGPVEVECLERWIKTSHGIAVTPQHPYSPSLRFKAGEVTKLSVIAEVVNSEYDDAMLVVEYPNKEGKTIRSEFQVSRFSKFSGEDAVTINIYIKDAADEGDLVSYIWNYGGENLELADLRIIAFFRV